MTSVCLTASCGAPSTQDVVDDESSDALQLAPATECAPLPSDADPQAVDAYNRVNEFRQAVGLPCSDYAPKLALAAQEHAEYYATNSRDSKCIASPHREVDSCKGFVAQMFGDRDKAAGYTGYPAYEDMTYLGDGARAVDKWVDSVWHRIPVLSPFVGESGYGRAKAVDTMDFAWAATPVSDAPVMYPFDGQDKLPRTFEGELESPALPEPPQGWPSGYPIMVYASKLAVTSHMLFDDDGKPVDHTFIGSTDPASMGILLHEAVIYANRPLKGHTKYRVVVDGTSDGKPLHLDWSFTTR